MYELDQIKADLPDLNERLTAWNKKFNREFWNYPLHNPYGPEAVKIYTDYVFAKIGREPIDEAFEMLDTLGTVYMQATPGERAEIRDLIRQNKAVRREIYSYTGRAAKLVEETRDPKWLTLGLAAISITDPQGYFRDYLIAMGDLYLGAARVGIDPRPYFKAVGEISNSVKRGEKEIKNHPHPILKRLMVSLDWSTKQTISNFENTYYFRSEVKSKLRKK